MRRDEELVPGSSDADERLHVDRLWVDELSLCSGFSEFTLCLESCSVSFFLYSSLGNLHLFLLLRCSFRRG